MEREGAREGPDDAAARAFATREEKLAYLAGLVRGVRQEEEPARASLLSGIVDVLADMARELAAVRREQRTLAEDLEELADEIGVPTADVVVDCPSCGREVAFASSLLGEDEVELTCPNCGDVVYTPGEDELVDGPEGNDGEPGAAAGIDSAGREGED